jgi:hypothetical protein
MQSAPHDGTRMLFLPMWERARIPAVPSGHLPEWLVTNRVWRFRRSCFPVRCNRDGLCRSALVKLNKGRLLEPSTGPAGAHPRKRLGAAVTSAPYPEVVQAAKVQLMRPPNSESFSLGGAYKCCTETGRRFPPRSRWPETRKRRLAFDERKVVAPVDYNEFAIGVRNRIGRSRESVKQRDL